ncbi:prephenate dehydrogenase [Methanobrevibacter arboriphilus]|jgi:prephenate dehydrogenase|uniref:Prephenate dehydrogenase n=1 Tax=Methanobrevibacter arboriphilus TaxID=39441 RepID=A0ACA8R3M1_METAZ|nr:prephenate dehydrogenase [Methanobrevibacter arboriphilus]MCC7562518.1 prephenate dehydrogenase [Methanobrevibacter arboriphilus]BBL61907.1 prephenate dehydrogenase [Methanobrevibacter arboriphilus]GLI11019.1 prephenate dehydrogenase [Methanobrevibacter arboriphilus]
MKIGIIGGTRGLGKTLASILSKEGFDITITGRDTVTGNQVSEDLKVEYSNDNKKVASSSDIIIISVPISTTSKVIKEIAKSVTPGSLVVDVTSVKVEPSNLMKNLLNNDVEFIPTHPVFGPRTTNLEGQVVVLTPISQKQKEEKWYPKVLKFLKDRKVRIIEASPEEHDNMMAVVQVLTHFSYISTASAIKKLGINIKDTRKFASPIYNLMVDMISRIVSQNPFLTYSIQLENQNGEKVRQTFADSVLELKKVLTNHDKDNFVKIAIEATKNLDDIQSALGRSDKAIDSQNHELTILKNSIGKEIALQHIYSEEVHIGVLNQVNPDFIILDTGKNQKKLKIANIKILDKYDFLDWKIKTQTTKTNSISCIFPKNSNAEVIKNTIKNCVDDIISIKVTDIYTGHQISEGNISFTFEIVAFDKSTFKSVKNVLEGFGGIIR